MEEEVKSELRKKPGKLELVLLGVVLTGLGLGFAYGVFRGCKYLSKKIVQFDSSYTMILPNKNYTDM